MSLKHRLKSAQNTFLLRFCLNTDRITQWADRKVNDNTFADGIESMPSLNLDLLHRFAKATASDDAFGFLIALMQFEYIHRGQENNSKFKWMCTNFPQFSIPRHARLTDNSIGNWIHATYIEPSGPYGLNLNAPTLSSLKAAYEGVATVYTPETFDDARFEALNLMQSARHHWTPDGAKIVV